MRHGSRIALKGTVAEFMRKIPKLRERLGRAAVEALKLVDHMSLIEVSRSLGDRRPTPVGFVPVQSQRLVCAMKPFKALWGKPNEFLKHPLNLTKAETVR